MLTQPFELNDSISSSVSVSNLSEKSLSLIDKERSSYISKSQFKAIPTTISVYSSKKFKLKRYSFFASLFLIPLVFYLILRSWLYSFSFILLPFPPHYPKGLIDDNEYQLLQLKNHIEFSLISNNNSSISTFQLMISAGTSNDPEELHGLSHLALITKLSMPLADFAQKQSNLIKQFNMSHYIDEELSKITFEIDSSLFWDCIRHLIHSINSQDDPSDKLIEDSLDDLQRTFYALKSSDYYKELTIINTFLYEKDNFIGNYDSLRKNDQYALQLKRELRRMIDKYYIGNNMKIVIETRDCLKEIRDKVTSLFKTISYESIPASNKINENIVKYSNLGKVLLIESHIFMKNLKLLFIIPQPSKESFIYYDYIAYLLNKKEKDSLYMKLTSLSLINNFESKISRTLTTHMQFELNFNLTTQGIMSVPLIVHKAFAHLANVTNSGIDQKSFHEFANIKRILQIYNEEGHRDRIKRLGRYLQNKLSYDDYLAFNSASYIVNGTINNFLTLKHSFVIIEANKVDFFKYNFSSWSEVKIERHFGTMYNQKDITTKELEAFSTPRIELINSEWSLNQFLTNNSMRIDFDKANNPEEVNEMEPSIIYKTNYVTIWHRLDRSFSMPIVIATINIISPFLRSTNEIEYFAHVLFFNSLKKQLMIQLDQAIQAGNYIHMKLSDNGFTITIKAYSDVIWDILKVISTEYEKPLVDSETMANTVEEFNYLKYFSLTKRGRHYFRRIIKYNLQSSITGQPTSEEPINNLLLHISNNSIVIVLFYGNIYKEDTLLRLSKSLPRRLNSTFPFSLNKRTFLNPEKVLDYLHYHEDINGSYIFIMNNSDSYEANHLLNNYYQIGLKSHELIAESSLLISILSDVARGFLLLGNLRVLELAEIDNCLYFDFHVEHLTLNPELINKQLDIIIEALDSKIRGLTDDELSAYKNKIAFKMREEYPTLYDKDIRVWHEIYKNTLNFKRRSLEDFFINYNKVKLIQFYKKVFINKDSLKKISIQLYKNSTEDYVPGINTTLKYRLNQEIESYITDDIDILRKRNHKLIS